MPAEWAWHARTWIEFPTPSSVFGDAGSLRLARAQAAWAGVANTLVEYEPVTVLVPPGQRKAANQLLAPEVARHDASTESAWLRDSGPTFVRTPEGGTAAVNWVFNGWGSEELVKWGPERSVARTVARAADVDVVDSPLVQEGGGLHVDGEGTVLVTETVQLDPRRNPGWSRSQVEAELRKRLGTTKAIWLPRGLSTDYCQFGTQGHVDMLAAFVRPGVVVVHQQTDPTHPDYEVCRQTIALLRDAVDARGRRLVVIPLPAPTIQEVNGHPAHYSYINHYVANGIVLLGVFDDPRDTLAGQILRRIYRRRGVLLFDARDFFAFGGGLHSVTQQQPA
jgi:agmatine deiminase